MNEKEVLKRIESETKNTPKCCGDADDMKYLLSLVDKKNRALVFCASILSTMHPWDQMKQQEVIDMVMNAGELK